ncbi:hypothetical protein [Brevibacillus fortis]|uniref:hypothetical protein n=1 Tax=Brevibacillus fortis TaxID=2126352 RepID=UPI0038FC5A6B
MKKKSSKILKKRGVKRKNIITLSRKNVRITESLGNGFFRHKYEPVVVDANSLTTIRLVAPGGRMAISAGWEKSLEPYLRPFMVVSSYPFSRNEWYLEIENPTGIGRLLTGYLITKLP